MVDAVEVSWQGPDRPTRLPGRSRIWIRIEGTWRVADVHRWILGVDPPTWLAWISYSLPGRGHRSWGLFVYNPATIRQRIDDQPPDDAPGAG